MRESLKIDLSKPFKILKIWRFDPHSRQKNVFFYIYRAIPNIDSSTSSFCFFYLVMARQKVANPSNSFNALAMDAKAGTCDVGYLDSSLMTSSPNPAIDVWVVDDEFGSNATSSSSTVPTLEPLPPCEPLSPPLPGMDFQSSKQRFNKKRVNHIKQMSNFCVGIYWYKWHSLISCYPVPHIHLTKSSVTKDISTNEEISPSKTYPPWLEPDTVGVYKFVQIS